MKSKLSVKIWALSFSLIIALPGLAAEVFPGVVCASSLSNYEDKNPYRAEMRLYLNSFRVEADGKVMVP